MRGATRQRRRRLFAITTAVLWLLGVEVLPNLHLAAHQDDHTHRHDGTIVPIARGSHDAEHAHAHEHGDHEHEDHDHAVAGHEHDVAGHEHATDHHHDELAAHEHDIEDHAHHDHDHEPELAAAEHGHEAPRETRASHDHPHGARRERSDRLAIDVVATGHAAYGIAHHALALLDPPPPELAPVGAPQPESWSHAAPTEIVHSAPRARPHAHGPPAIEDRLAS